MQSQGGEKELTHDEALAELRELVARAKSGDVEAVPRLREYLRRNPILWKRAGNIGLHAQAAWIRLIAGEDKHLQEVLVMRLNALKEEIGGTSPTPLEALLVERVAASWLQLCYAEAHDAQVDEKSLKWAEFKLKRHKALHDLHLKSIGALATIRKLLPQAGAPAAEASTKPDDPAGAPPEKAAQEPANGEPKNGHTHNRIAALLGADGAELTW